MSNMHHYSYRQDMGFRNTFVYFWPLDYIDVLVNLRDLLFFIISVYVSIEIFITFFGGSVNIAFGTSQHLILHMSCDLKNLTSSPEHLSLSPLPSLSFLQKTHCILLYCILKCIYLCLLLCYVYVYCLTHPSRIQSPRG